MAFINEFASEEDIKKYQLKELWLGGHLNYKEYPESFRLHWVRDSERDAFLMFVGGGNREQLEVFATLYFKGEYFSVELIKKVSGSNEADTGKWQIVWKVVSIDRKALTAKPVELIGLLKEALLTYGYRGVHKQLPNAKLDIVLEGM